MGPETTTGGSLGGASGAAGEGNAGASSEGSGGTATTDTTTGATTTGATQADTCEGSEIEPNDERTSATAYSLGTAFDACLQSITDVDVYEFSIPEDDRGGVVTVSVTDVGPDGDIDLALWAAADNGEFHSTGSNTEGGSVYFYFNAAAGATFHLEVTNYLTLDQPNPYRLSIEYHQVPDIHEPNQIRSQAVPIDVAEDVEGYAFAGYTNSTGVPDEEWYDWYSIELEAGATSFLVDVLASDIDHEIVLYNPLGTEITGQGTNTEGSSVLLEYEIPEAGTYFVRVNPYIPPLTQGNTLDIPEYATIPYTLTVTQ